MSAFTYFLESVFNGPVLPSQLPSPRFMRALHLLRALVTGALPFVAIESLHSWSFNSVTPLLLTGVATTSSGTSPAEWDEAHLSLLTSTYARVSTSQLQCSDRLHTSLCSSTEGIRKVRDCYPRDTT